MVAVDVVPAVDAAPVVVADEALVDLAEIAVVVPVGIDVVVDRDAMKKIQVSSSAL